MAAEALEKVSAGMVGKKADHTKRKEADRAVAAAALELAAEKGWRNLSLHDIALRTNVSLSELYKNYLSKEAILDSFVRAIDEEVLRGLDKAEEEDSPRDRLFDILMRRFDALQPYKQGIAAILKDAVCDPATLGLGACRYFLSMHWMLEGAGISTAGLHGVLRVKGLAAIYFGVLQIWLGDRSEDQGKTMAALDRWLKRAEWAETQFPWPDVPFAERADEPPAAP